MSFGRGKYASSRLGAESSRRCAEAADGGVVYEGGMDRVAFEVGFADDMLQFGSPLCCLRLRCWRWSSRGVAESSYEATRRRSGKSVRSQDKSAAIAFCTTQICDAGEWEMSSGDGSTVFALRARTDDRASPGSRGATMATCGNHFAAGSRFSS